MAVGSGLTFSVGAPIFRFASKIPIPLPTGLPKSAPQRSNAEGYFLVTPLTKKIKDSLAAMRDEPVDIGKNRS